MRISKEDGTWLLTMPKRARNEPRPAGRAAAQVRLPPEGEGDVLQRRKHVRYRIGAGPDARAGPGKTAGARSP